MKANNVPEKIYLTKNLLGELRDGWDALPSEVSPHIEYIRTDAFIEKARKWFEMQNEGVDSYGNYKCDMTDFEDFKNYMEGE